MKTISQLPIVKEVSSNFPFGAILNETDTSAGTPVVREVYNDILANIYKLLSQVGITANGNEDSETNGYQIIEALKKLANSLNDVEQTLDLSGSVFSFGMNTEFLPNKYLFIAKAQNDYVKGNSYTLKGSNSTTFSFTSNGFKAGEQVLVCLDVLGAKGYSISSADNASSEYFTVLGNPLSFNDTTELFYKEDGYLLSNLPLAQNIESTIRIDESDGTIILKDMVVKQGTLLCFCVKPSTNLHFFKKFDLTDLSVSENVNLGGVSFGSIANYSPIIYCDIESVYITNGMNTSNNAYNISKFTYNPISNILTLTSTFNLESSFVKTNNAVIKNDELITMIDGQISKYSFSLGTKVDAQRLNGVAGNLFNLAGNIYFTSGDVAVKFNL